MKKKNIVGMYLTYQQSYENNLEKKNVTEN